MLEMLQNRSERRSLPGLGHRVGHRETPRHGVGRIVEAAENGELSVHIDGRLVRARRAVSCLVEAAAADKVSVLELPDGEAYVLGVLERPSGAPIRVTCEGDLEVRPKRGKLRLGSADGVELESGLELGLRAPKLRMQAGEATIAARSLSYVGAAIGAHVNRVQLTATRVDAVVDRVSQMMKSFYRVVTETEHARAGRIDYTADDSLSMRGQTAFVTAGELVKLDGNQVHVG
jgi:hypothetical protein